MIVLFPSKSIIIPNTYHSGTEVQVQDPPPSGVPHGVVSRTAAAIELRLRRYRLLGVAYVCFGTVVAPLPGETLALGEALESSKTPFLWSLKEYVMAYLPEGLQERTRVYGKLVPWSPQGQVLSHPARMVYVTHCGYNLVFEIVVGGVPMVCKPFWADNMMKSGMTKSRVKVEDRIITKSRMTKALEVVLRSEEGKEMRKKVGELRERLVEAAGPRGSAEADFKALLQLISPS